MVFRPSADYMAGIEVSNALNVCFDREEHKRIYSDYIAQYGYDHFTITLVRQEATISEQNQSFSILTTYPDEWIKHYTENRYIGFDPLVELADKPGLIGRWEDTLLKCTFKEEGQTIFNEAAEHGLKYGGIGMTSLSPCGTLIGATLVGSERGVLDINQPASSVHVASLYHITEKFFTQHRDRFFGVQVLDNDLTERQHECLRMLAQPSVFRTEQDIAEKLNISINGVKKLRTRLYRKLGVTTRLQAVEKARELGVL